MTETKQDDVSKLANYCRVKLDLSDIQMPDEYGYSSLPLCIIDAVFSVGVTYTSTRNTVKIEECHPLLVSICEVLKTEYPDLTPRSLDHTIWLYQKSQ